MKHRSFVPAALTGICLAAAFACGSPTSPPPTPNPIPDPPVTQPPPPHPPTFAVTRIMAFGDSLTEGESLGQLFTTLNHDSSTPGIATSYPYKLQTTLTNTYTGQTIQVFNAGFGGEKVVGSQAKDRLTLELNARQPQVLLLMHGVNNVNASSDPIVTIVEGIEELIELAHARDVHVILGNLPPQIPTAKATGGSRIAAFNSQLPAVAAEEGASFVDIHSNIDTATMLMPDGLHLNEAGNVKVAELFYAALKAKYHREPAP